MQAQVVALLSVLAVKQCVQHKRYYISLLNLQLPHMIIFLHMCDKNTIHSSTGKCPSFLSYDKSAWKTTNI